jgi:hypothetical protein
MSSGSKGKEHEEQLVAVAIEGAVIIKEYQGAYTNKIIYRRRCDNCGYIAPSAPISVSCLPYDNQMYGYYHRERFVCSFCGNHQTVKIQGG